LGPVAQLKIIVAQQAWQLLMARRKKCKKQLRVVVVIVVGRAMGNGKCPSEDDSTREKKEWRRGDVGGKEEATFVRCGAVFPGWHWQAGLDTGAQN
jgi:hypothetical protein